MNYKTITLGLLQERPELYERLRSSKRLLTAMDVYAGELKVSHEHWKDQLGRSSRECDPRQIASQAMELAIEDLQARLPSASPKDEAELMTDAATGLPRHHTPPA